MKLAAAVASVLALCVVGYVRLAADPPGLDRARFHHWRNAEAMTALAEHALQIPDLRWIALDGEEVIGSFGSGSTKTVPAPLREPHQNDVLRLMESARTGHLFLEEDRSSAFVELLYWWPVRDRTYHTMLLFRGAERTLCVAAVFDAPEGACQFRLDDDWTLEYLWYPKAVLEDAA